MHRKLHSKSLVIGKPFLCSKVGIAFEEKKDGMYI